MSFWWDSKISDYLFKGLSPKSPFGFIVICIIIAIMSFTFEFIRYLQAKQRQKELILRSEQLKTICPTESSTLLTENVSAPDPGINITIIDRCLSNFFNFFII